MRESSAATPCHAPDQGSDDERGRLLEHQYAEVVAVADGNTVGGPSSEAQTKPVAGGTILGIHNLAIVMPQFIVRPFHTSLIFLSSLTLTSRHATDRSRRERHLPFRRRISA
jgi:hypothetical protein